MSDTAVKKETVSTGEPLKEKQDKPSFASGKEGASVKSIFNSIALPSQFFEESYSEKSMMDLIALSQKMMATFFNGNSPFHQTPAVFDPLNSTQVWVDFVTAAMRNPNKVAEAQFNLWQDCLNLWSNMRRQVAGEQVNPLIQPEKSDRRFKDEGWNEVYFDFMKQFYLLSSKSMLEMTDALNHNLDKKTRSRMNFFIRQMMDALSPSNYVMSNPEILRTTLKTNGQNLVKGMQNFLSDLERGKGRLAIRQTDLDAFKVGDNLATTQGSVVYENELMQLIQYSPKTEKVYQKPLLIIPPWINKFYILDLQPKNSFIKWVVEQGYTVFVVSWANPDQSHANYKFEDYIEKGIMASLDAIEKTTGEKQISAIGYCIAGTLLTMALSIMKQKGENRITNATYFASQSDFSDAGELGIFVDPIQIENMKTMMAKNGGYLEGYEMSSTFNMLRANDLIWSFVVSNYLLGKEPFPFDLLYWNSDATRMPMQLQLDYMHHCYLNNDLANGRMKVAGMTLNVSDVDIPVYMQAAREDHIAPPASVFRGAKLYSGDVRFILSGSGHIAGVINHPDAKKYQFWTHDKKAVRDYKELEDWQDDTTETAGSWWNDWSTWLSEKSGEMVSSKNRSPEKYAIEPAPGRYVLGK